MKKVLLLAYYFPPRNRISSYRLAGFCRHLPQFGWEPTVICEDWPSHAPDYDSSLIEGLHNINVHRLNSYKPRGVERLFVRNVYPWVYPARTPYNWWKLARNKASKLCDAEKFDAILASHDPLATLSIAKELSTKFNIPWIADLRDSWNVQTLSSPRKQKLIASQELKLCKDAHQVVTVSGEIASRLESLISKKVHVVENGFDELTDQSTHNRKDDIFSILYGGSIAVSRQDPLPLLKALKQCIEDDKIRRDSFELRFLGSPKDSIPKQYFKQFEVVPICFLPRVSRKEALRQMNDSSLLWVIPHPHEKGVLTGKIFDYLSTGRPIIAVPDDKGEINQLLNQTKAGYNLSDHNMIMATILKFYESWKEDKNFKLNTDKSVVLSHSRKNKTEKLAQILNSIV